MATLGSGRPRGSMIFKSIVCDSATTRCVSSKARYVTRHCLALRGRKRLHQFHHVGIIGPLAIGKAVHRLDQIVVTLTGQSRRRQAADKTWLMANLAYRHPVGRRCRGSGTGPCRPGLFREISRCRAELGLRQIFGKGRHERALTIPALVVVQLFYQKIFLLTPDDRNDRIDGPAIRAVAAGGTWAFAVVVSAASTAEITRAPENRGK